MDIKGRSSFRSQTEDEAWFRAWVAELEKLNNKTYAEHSLESSLGKTHVWSLNHDSKELPSLVIFPGARTTALIWDFNNNLQELEKEYRIYLVETNGLPNLSEGNSPNIKSLDYGKWAEEVLDRLEIEQSVIAGASFGGLIAMKLGIVAPQRIIAAILLNSAGLQTFSLTWQNLYYNILPIIFPSKENISKFLDVAIFHSPDHQLTPAYYNLLVDYEHFAIKRYKDKTQKPYYLGKQLREVKVDIHLIEGGKDLLFPAGKSISNARKFLKQLKSVELFEQVGHGIETYKQAIDAMKEIIHKLPHSS